MSTDIKMGEDVNFNLLYVHSIYFNEKTPHAEKIYDGKNRGEEMKCSLSTHGLYLKARHRALKIEVDKKEK